MGALQGDPSHPPGRLLRRTTAGLVLAVLLAAGASYRFDLGDRLDVAAVEPAAPPAAVPPPLDLPVAPGSVGPVAAPTAPREADAAAVASAVRRLARDRSLGRHVSLAVAEVSSGRTLFAEGAPVSIPASTLKLLTAAAALEALGPEHRFSTTVVRTGRRLVLVGGGDPLLTRLPVTEDTYPERADLTTLARRTGRALRGAGVAQVRLGYDVSLFTGSPVAPSWEADYVPDDVVSPITSLWVDQGRDRPGFAARAADPARAAAEHFAAALAAVGVRVVGSPRPTRAPASAAPVALVESAPLSQVVEHVLETSDNEGAEVLARHVALARGDDPSFAGGTAAVVEVLSQLGVRMREAAVHDGSGLSRADRLHRSTLLDVLHLAATDPDLRTVVTGLPVAGFTGSLSSRFQTADRVALGEVRAKTGTLRGVSGLAGTVRTADGVLLAFVAIADRVRPPDTLEARATLDEIAGALAACLCG